MLRSVRKPRTLRVLVFPVVVSARGANALCTGSAHRREPKILKYATKDRPRLRVVKGALLGVHLSVARIENGVNHELTSCPRCGQALVDRGYAYYCAYGCTREFPKVGALLSDRFEHERKSGLMTAQHELEGRDGFTWGLGAMKTAKQREKDREYARRYVKSQQKKRRLRMLG